MEYQGGALGAMGNEYENLNSSAKEEIKEAITPAASVLFLRNWQEVSKLFIDYLRNSPSSPFCKVGAIFVRYEYQKDAGNLSHIHLILHVIWESLSDTEKEFDRDLIRASGGEIVRFDEVQSMIDEGIYKSHQDWHAMQEMAQTILPHV